MAWESLSSDAKQRPSQAIAEALRIQMTKKPVTLFRETGLSDYMLLS
jgi:hypothetical protein